MGETGNHHFHDFGISGQVHDSQNQYIFFETPRYSKQSKKKPESCFQEILFLKIEKFANPQFWKCRERWGPEK